jgi:hypothetical protein
VKEKSGGGLASTFRAVHCPASSLVPYAFPIHVNRIGRRIWSLIAACTAIWRGRENAAYGTLVRALLKQAPVRIQDVGLEGDRLGHFPEEALKIVPWLPPNFAAGTFSSGSLQDYPDRILSSCSFLSHKRLQTYKISSNWFYGAKARRAARGEFETAAEGHPGRSRAS